MAAKKSIANRWFVNSFSVVAVLLIIIDISVFFMLRSYYYNAVSRYLSAEAGIIHGILDYMGDYGAEIRRTVEGFDKKSIIELMAITGDGKVDLTSSGFSPNESYDMPDYTKAKQSEAGIGEHIGFLPNAERYMAITVMLSNNEETGYGAIRLITSLDNVDMQIYSTTLFVGLLSIAVLLLLLALGLYFVKSIVSPLRYIGLSAQSLAGGDFSRRITPSRHDDEISELCRIFNYMAEELENSEHMKNDFISSVSHELRTPLTAIRGWSDTILQSEHDDILFQKGMRVISTETARLSEMVEELLDFSRIQSGRLTFQNSNFDVLAELADALLIYTDKARRENVKIIYDEPDAAVAIVNGDKNRIRQVFINIIDNALKYTANFTNGKQQAEIEVTVNIEAAKIIISIKDTGMGISETDLPKVKTKFFKADTSVRGSGIGLAVADEIITRHGGELKIKSKQGLGTTVIIVLPTVQKKQ